MIAAVLFSGIGGWEIAAELNGIDVAWAAEWDDWKRARYAERWPVTPLYGDVGGLDGRRLVATHGPLDMLLASPPCTGISAANVHGLGLDDAESRYYIDAIRLADETRARWIGFENSPRLRTRGADRVLSLLGEAGYACWPCVVEAEDAGAPHQRGRSFVIGCQRDVIDGADAIGGGLRQQPGRGGGTDGTGAAEPRYDDTDASGERPSEVGHGQAAAIRRRDAVPGICREENADADLDGQPDRTKHGQVGGRPRTDGAAGACGGEAADVHSVKGRHRTGRRNGSQALDGTRPTPCHSASRARSEWQGVGGDPFEKLSPAQRAALSPWDQRGDGLAGYLSVADGLAARLRGHGLSEPAVKAELSRWRSALGDALVIPVVWAVLRAIVRTDQQIRLSRFAA